MTSKKDKKIAQPPVNPRKLLSLSGFTSYCSDNGLKTSSEQLEKLHKDGLFYPAIKIYRGITPERKILATINGTEGWYFVDPKDVKKFKPKKVDPETYYSSCGFFMSGDDWLDYYKNNKMIEHPASFAFKPWTGMAVDYHTTNTKQIGNSYDYFFDKNQLLTLKMVRKYLGMWEMMNDTEKAKFRITISERTEKYYRFLDLYYQVEKFYYKVVEHKSKHLKNFKTDETKRSDIIDEIEVELKPIYKHDAQKILNDFKVDIDYVKEWRSFLAEHSLLNEVYRSYSIRQAYIRAIDTDQLLNAEDVNLMIFMLNFFINVLTGERKQVKEIIGELAYKCCVVCGNSFVAKKDTQITCGNPSCITENKNRSKRSARKRK